MAENFQLPSTKLLFVGPKRCVIFLLSVAAIEQSVTNDGDRTSDTIASLDHIARLGCCGQVYMLKTTVAIDPNLDTCLQFMGFDTNLSHEESIVAWKTRHQKLTIKLFSSEISIIEDAKRYITDVSLIRSGDHLPDLSADVNVIHVNVDSSVDKMWVDAMCEEASKDADALMVGVSMPAGHKQSKVEPNFETFDYRPAQSYTFKNGKVVEVQTTKALATYYQKDSTRCDIGDHFNDKEMMHGCNLAINTHHFLYEIAYKLGKVPKHGA